MVLSVGKYATTHGVGDESLPAVMIMDNFKGQVTKDVLTLLDSNAALLPPNITNKLQCFG